MNMAAATTEPQSHVCEAEGCCMVLGKVMSTVRFAQIGPDVWSLYTMHGAGNSRMSPKIPNRMLAFRLCSKQLSVFMKRLRRNGYDVD